ncbi:uncharacterized protein OCT59_024558 [Rhizophagus irregularis]|uniref:uncharacterized protein n=1 Tax=Rhizophagus irregularis TaxID=588596 RepID=UPI00331885FC|nr:hypothetical protein OCT59_024558 [Rhizophagus irregularis]
MRKIQLGVCGSSANFPQKTFPEKITQNKESEKMANITLNCLIVPKGDLMNISFIKVMQAITISSSNHVSDLETVIQDRLGAPFNNIPLKICKIHPGSVTEMQNALNFRLKNL